MECCAQSLLAIYLFKGMGEDKELDAGTGPVVMVAL